MGYQTMVYAWWKYKNSQVRAKGERVKAERDAKEYPWLKEIDRESEILEMDVSQLRQGLMSGRFTSVDLVHVFARRCMQIGRRLCLSTEENFEEALKLAVIRDEERTKALKDGTAHLLPPLHGIPISTKEMVTLRYFH